MLDRVNERFDLWTQRLVAEAGYGSAENLAWLVHERGIERISQRSTNPLGPTAPLPGPTLPESAH